MNPEVTKYKRRVNQLAAKGVGAYHYKDLIKLKRKEYCHWC
jgi:hypothetical protein